MRRRKAGPRSHAVAELAIGIIEQWLSEALVADLAAIVVRRTMLIIQHPCAYRPPKYSFIKNGNSSFSGLTRTAACI